MIWVILIFQKINELDACSDIPGMPGENQKELPVDKSLGKMIYIFCLLFPHDQQSITFFHSKPNLIWLHPINNNETITRPLWCFTCLTVIHRIMTGKSMIFDWSKVIDSNDFIGWVWGVSVQQSHDLWNACVILEGKWTLFCGKIGPKWLWDFSLITRGHMGGRTFLMT